LQFLDVIYRNGGQQLMLNVIETAKASAHRSRSV
jgi:hypothetical protein